MASKGPSLTSDAEKRSYRSAQCKEARIPLKETTVLSLKFKLLKIPCLLSRSHKPVLLTLGLDTDTRVWSGFRSENSLFV